MIDLIRKQIAHAFVFLTSHENYWVFVSIVFLSDEKAAMFQDSLPWVIGQEEDRNAGPRNEANNVAV